MDSFSSMFRSIFGLIFNSHFRRILDGGIKTPTAMSSNPQGREIFVYDKTTAKITFLSDSGRLLTQLSMSVKSDTSGKLGKQDVMLNDSQDLTAVLWYTTTRNYSLWTRIITVSKSLLRENSGNTSAQLSLME